MKKYNYFTDNEDLLNEYDKREAYLFYQASLMRGATNDGIEEGMKIGIEKGRLEGEENKAISIAKSLKASGLDNKFISEHTGLTVEEIEKI